MRDPALRHDAELVLALMFHGLRVNDPKMNAVAAELLTRYGTNPVRRLVLEAASKKNAVGYRLRALEVIRRIGTVSCLDDFADLTLLLNDRNERVRQAVRGILGR